MRRTILGLFLSLCFTLPVAAHADTYQYTIIWDFPHIATANTSAFLGTYTFTVDSLLTGDTFVYGPGFTDPEFHGYPYVYAADLIVPQASNVSQLEITYLPGTNYGVDLYQAKGAQVVGTSLLPSPGNPNKFIADYGDGSGDFVSMEFEDLGPSSIPEPSTIALLGSGILAIAPRIYRRSARATI